MKRPRQARQRAGSPPFRAIPAVEKLLQAIGPTALPRPMVVQAVRRKLADLRKAKVIPPFEAVVEAIRKALEDLQRARLQPVINGTGILVHTNLGRAPLGSDAVEALAQVAAHYNNLEYDLGGGERGGRAAYLEQALTLVCGAEAATVVNNCAAALVLALRHFVRRRREVIISRGELVQIGGGFRIPEILEASGAQLREVGTTNRTSLRDYAEAIGSETALILKVHRSNFFMDGFVESPTTEAIAALSREQKIPFLEDLGSGAVIATEQVPGLEHEPTPAEVLKKGVDLVTFSGDKLLGGPQAGILAGNAKLIAALKREPFFRALRCDKLILAALQTTVELYLRNAAERSVPILKMLHASEEELRARAERISEALRAAGFTARVGRGRSQVGGGALPRSILNSIAVELTAPNLAAAELTSRLRRGTPPVVGFVSGGKFKVDLRTVFPSQDDALTRALQAQIALPP
jgi:L-seryl-tRNA(Ser) seleniumtransferase